MNFIGFLVATIISISSYSAAYAESSYSKPINDGFGHGISGFPKAIGSTESVQPSSPPIARPLRVAPPYWGLSKDDDLERIAGIHNPSDHDLAPLDVLRDEVVAYRLQENDKSDLTFLQNIILNGPEKMARDAIANSDFRFIRQSTGLRLVDPDKEELWEQPFLVICSKPVPVIDVGFGCFGAPFSVYRTLMQYNTAIYAQAPETLKSICHPDEVFIQMQEKYELERAVEWARRNQSK